MTLVNKLPLQSTWREIRRNIRAEGGGSTGSRVRWWKWEMQQLIDEMGLSITVCHLPPGTRTWNKIEQSLFAWISQNWRGQPLVSYAVILKLIAATTTEAGLTVQCQLDTNLYPAGRKIADEDMATSPYNRTHSTMNGPIPYRLGPLQLIL